MARFIQEDSEEMKKALVIFLTLSGVTIFAFKMMRNQNDLPGFLKLPKKNTIKLNLSEPPVALFSFQPNAQNNILGSCYHYTIQLHNTKRLKIKKNTIEHISKGIPLVLTIETWKGNGIFSYKKNVLTEIAEGKYDNILQDLCNVFVGERPNVYFRFNPEMEVPVNLFPWQNTGVQSYISAFRHFTSICRQHAPQVKIIWAPAGYPGAMEFYPGNDVVDFASITVKSESEVPLDVYPKNYAIAYDVFRRLHRLRFIDKPIFILGSKQNDNDSINNQLLFNLSRKINQQKGVSYLEDNFKHPPQKKQSTERKKTEIGVFDENERLNDEELVTSEHIFTDFSMVIDGTFKKLFAKIIERGNNVIVTFEPHKNPKTEVEFDVLQNVTKGKYDKEIDKLYSIILATKNRVYLRYAHEMEIPTTRYPWQLQDPLTYINSYRYFMTFKDSLPPNIKRVWGPAGDRGSLEWYPGNDVVDYVSIAIYGLPDKNITNPEKQESFDKIFSRKYWRLRFINKPIFITEFGVKGPEEYQTNWLEEAAKVIRDNPQIQGVSYFNRSDVPNAWGEIKPPDWSITKKTFYRFLEVLNH